MQIPSQVKTLFKKTDLISFGTADSKCNPNINFVFWKLIPDDETILLIDNYMNTTKTNILENGNICLSFCDPQTEEGYKIKGIGKYHTDGSAFEAGKNFLQTKNPDRMPNGVIEIKVTEIYNLTPGPNAGSKL